MMVDCIVYKNKRLSFYFCCFFCLYFDIIELLTDSNELKC